MYLVLGRGLVFFWPNVTAPRGSWDWRCNLGWLPAHRLLSLRVLGGTQPLGPREHVPMGKAPQQFPCRPCASPALSTCIAWCVLTALCREWPAQCARKRTSSSSRLMGPPGLPGSWGALSTAPQSYPRHAVRLPVSTWEHRAPWVPSRDNNRLKKCWPGWTTSWTGAPPFSGPPAYCRSEPAHSDLCEVRAHQLNTKRDVQVGFHFGGESLVLLSGHLSRM